MGTKADFLAAFGGAGVTINSQAVSGVNTGTNALTVTAHGRASGDGPVEVNSSGGNVPTGLGGIAASGVLTGTGNAINNETVTIDGQVYTFKNTLTGAADEIKIQANVAASKVLTIAVGNASNADTVTIDGRVYTFKTALTPTAGEVLIGLTAAASGTNLFEAITAGAGSGTDYAAGTAVHATVTATDGGDGTVTVTAKTAGTAGNSIAISESGTNISWAGGATALSGGAMNLQTTLANLKKAINAEAGSGTNYGTGTVEHETVECTASDATTLTVAAKTVGDAGSLLAVTDGMTLASWGALTLTGGQDNAHYVIVVDANTIKLADTYALAIAGTPLDISGSGSGTITISTSSTLLADRIETAITDWLAPGNRTAPTDVQISKFWDQLVLAF